MSAPACADRGADLFVLARGGDPEDPGLREHVAGCAACREELGRLGVLARRLPLASAGLAPRPSTRETVRREIRTGPGALPAPRRRGGRILLWALPAGLAAASVLAVLVLAERDGGGPADGGGVAVSGLHGATLAGPLGDGRLSRDETVTASANLAVHLGAPFETEAVFGEGTSFRLPAAASSRRDGTPRSLEVLSGPAFFDASPLPGEEGPPLRVLAAGTATVETRGARFAVEVRGRGAATVYVESGVVRVSAAGRTVEARGPARIDVPPGRAPEDPVPAEPTDATGWFAYPRVRAEVRPGPAGEGPELVVTLEPSVPRTIPVAPFSRFDPLFTLRATREGEGLREIPLEARMLRAPAPEAGPDGAFPLAPDRPYLLRIDPDRLGLGAGRWEVGVLYNATRPGGLWRGSRASNTVELRVNPR